MEKCILGLLIVTVYLGIAFGQRPQIVEDIFTEVKRIGGTGYLNCTVSRKQNSKVIWIQPSPGLHDAWISKDTTILAKNQEINGKLKYEVIQQYKGNDRTTYTLVINRLTVDDGGRYKCTVFMQGTDVSQWPVKYGNLTVQVPPEIIVSQTSNTQEKNQGEAMSLTCNATGIPTPNITWIRADGRPLPNNALSQKGHFLNITNLRKDDRGTYRCVADNSVIPPAEYDIRVVVLFKPEARAIQLDVGQAKNRRFSAILNCRISGMPQPILRWYRIAKNKKETLQDDSKYDINQLLVDGTSLQLSDTWYSLKILNVQANDFGLYYCEGTNNLGTATAMIELYETNECQGLDCDSVVVTKDPQSSRDIDGSTTQSSRNTDGSGTLSPPNIDGPGTQYFWNIDGSGTIRASSLLVFILITFVLCWLKA